MKNSKLDIEKIKAMLQPADGCSCGQCGNVSLNHPYKKAGAGWGFCTSKKCKLYDMSVQLEAVRTCRAHIPIHATRRYESADATGMRATLVEH